MSDRGVHRVDVPDQVADADPLGRPDYASAFRLATPRARVRTPELWARAVFEDAPALLRPVLVFGWRVGLGLRLGRRPSPGSVLGWSASDVGPDTVALGAESRLLRAWNVVVVDESSVTWVTLVRFERPVARPIWAVTSVVHHRAIPYLLGRAARSLPG
jgi:hypothetical protein